MAAATTPTYVLTYFNSRGLAEISRIMLAAAGVEYKDVRIPREEWAALKPKTPYGQIPTLTLANGQTFGQSFAIARFIAREHGFYGSSNVEALAIDSLIEALLDARKTYQAARQIKDNEVEKKAKIDAYLAEEWPQWGAKINAVLAAHDEGKGWSVGTKLSISDVAIHQFVHHIVGVERATTAFPLIAALVAKVDAVPAIAAWIAKRPVTEF